MSRSDAPGHPGAANRLLGALPAREYARLGPHLTPVRLHARAVLHEPGRPLEHVYFPTEGVISLLAVLADAGSVEVGLVGREGMAGLPAFLGADATLSRALVQVPGAALCMPVAALRDLGERLGRFRRLLLRYTHAFLAQVSQSLACNSLHPVEQRMCRWLLMLRGRAEAESFPLTHELLASMLGVRRATVTVTVRTLQRQGLIRSGRGTVDVLDKGGLESAACECYQQVQAEWDRLFA